VTAPLAAITLALLAACALPPPPITVRVGVLGSVDELPLFVIQEQGFDRTYGVRLQPSTLMSGARILEAMAAGSLDFSWNVGTVPLLRGADDGTVPARAVAVAVNTFADRERPGIGVVASHTVKTWPDLSGQLIGVYAIDSLGGAAVRAQLQHERVADYRLVEIAMPNLGLAVGSGTVTAAVMPEPFVTQSILRGDGRLLGWVIGGPPLERMVYTVLAARAQFYHEQPEAMTALLRAHLDAVRWINANPELARAIIARRLGITDDLGRRIKLLRWAPDGRNDPALFMAMQEVLVDAGILRAPVPVHRVFEESRLNAVLPERRR
jgi:NitT/TauT family transport system substrate-binding protein